MNKKEFFESKSPLTIAYVSTRDLPNVTESDAKIIDIVNIAFAHVVEDACVWEEGGPAAREALDRLVELNPDIKFVISVGGWSAGGFSEAAETEEGRKTFARTAAALVKEFDLHGVDIDWEYPGSSMGGIKSSPNDKENFTLYLQEIRNSLDALSEETGNEYSLSIATGGDAYFIRNTEMDKVAAILDYVQIMTYDLRGGYTHATGHHTNLFTPLNDFNNVSVQSAVEDFNAAGVPKEKMVIGAAFYSRLWKGVPAGTEGFDFGYNQMAETQGGYGPSYDDLVDNWIEKNGFVRYWDDVAKAPWLYDGETFVSYDDPESIAEKVKYLKEEGLLGIMYWEYALASKYSLTQAIEDAMNS